MSIDAPESLSTLKNSESPLDGRLDDDSRVLGGIKRDRSCDMKDSMWIDRLDNFIESPYLSMKLFA